MPVEPRLSYTVFNYLYRDGGNYKSYGSVLLLGKISQSDRDLVDSKLEGGEFFIAEQIGIKPLYNALYQFSDGMTAQDHVWHTSEGFEDANEPSDFDQAECWGTTRQFAEKFERVERWHLYLSTHAMLTG